MRDFLNYQMKQTELKKNADIQFEQRIQDQQAYQRSKIMKRLEEEKYKEQKKLILLTKEFNRKNDMLKLQTNTLNSLNLSNIQKQYQSLDGQINVLFKQEQEKKAKLKQQI